MKIPPGLPLDAVVRIQQLPPAAQESALKCYPSEERDREVRAAREAEAKRRAAEEFARRLKLCEQALSGEHGRDVKAKAARVITECGGETTPTAVQRIFQIVRDFEREKRNRRKAKPRSNDGGK